MRKMSIEDVDLTSRRILTRVDFNVPIDEKGNITDATRIKESLPTIKYVIERKGKLILMSHLGRPKGKEEIYKMDNVAKSLSESLGKEVKKVDDCVGQNIEKIVHRMKDGDVILLENLRFHKEEEENNEEFSKQLAFLGDIYVNDAFGSSHRAHSSIVGIPKYLKAVAGLLMKKEIQYLSGLLESPDKPYIAVLGGAKVSDKITVLQNLLSYVDSLIIGGGMAYTFLYAMEVKIGKSKLENDKIHVAKNIISTAQSMNKEILLPLDHLIADKIDKKARLRITKGDIIDDWIGVDIGPQTILNFTEKIKHAQTVFWNGPMGVFEIDKFSEGTRSICKAISEVQGTTVAGGGDTISAIQMFEMANKFSHISTGGGACLEFLEGKTLPGIAALTNK